MLLLKMLITLSLFSNLNLSHIPYNNQDTIPPPKVIKEPHTNFPKKENWVTIPKGKNEIIISLEAQNTETVLFWLIPTGTQTWWERRLIGYDINKDKENKFNKTQKYSLIWKIDEPFLHHHLEVELIGMNEVIDGGIINIHTE